MGVSRSPVLLRQLAPLFRRLRPDQDLHPRILQAYFRYRASDALREYPDLRCHVVDAFRLSGKWRARPLHSCNISRLLF